MSTKTTFTSTAVPTEYQLTSTGTPTYRVFTEEHRKKLSAKAKGKIVSEETKKKMSDYHKKLSGDKAPNWKGGKSFHKVMNKNVNGGSHTVGEWETLKKQYGMTCPSCQKSEPEIKLTEDHIIPTSKGGSDYIENIQPLCVSCNSRKSNKVMKY